MFSLVSLMIELTVWQGVRKMKERLDILQGSKYFICYSLYPLIVRLIHAEWLGIQEQVRSSKWFHWT